MPPASRYIRAPTTGVSQRIPSVGVGVGIAHRFGADPGDPRVSHEAFPMIGALCEENEFDNSSLIGS